MTTPTPSTMEGISISHEEGESSRANDQNPTLELTKQERLDMLINERVRRFLEEGQKLQAAARRASTSSIYRVLARLETNNGSWPYKPKMICIGPYYYNPDDQNYKLAEDCKRKCFGSLMVKARRENMQVHIYRSCLNRMKEREVEIKKCYSEEFPVSGFYLHEMMIVDASFIIEVIDTFGSGKEVDPSDSLAALEWMLPYFYRDFLLLENQIPFFVLEEIYALSRKVLIGTDSKTNLIYAALEFFKNGMKKFDIDIFNFVSMNAAENKQYSPLHLLDLVRSSLIPKDLVRSSLIPRIDEEQGPQFPTQTTFIHCVSKLLLAGIKVSPVKAQSFLEVKFKEGVIEMPNIAINDLMICLLLNCVAFEQRHQRSGKHFSVYATFLDCLVNTPKDIEYLLERNVIDNYLADDFEAADFINGAGKDLVFSTENDFYLGKLFKDVDEHYRKTWKWKLARFTGEYIEKPWLFLSATGGILLVLGTLVQAIVAFLTFKYKN